MTRSLKAMANKQILAQTAKGCVNEYNDCTVMILLSKYIEGTEVGLVACVDDGLNRPKIVTDVIKRQQRGLYAD